MITDVDRQEDLINQVSQRYKKLSPYLTEKSKRIWAASEALAIGRGGNTVVCKATGISRMTINRGKAETEERDSLDTAKIRQNGGGRKKLVEHDPQLLSTLDTLIDPSTRGDPESPLRWTCKSTYKLAETLEENGYPISPRTLSKLLKEQGYSLQANRKIVEGNQHPDRDAQFQNINQLVKRFQQLEQPVISVDAKKKENIGNFKNSGKEWHKKGEATGVNTYDFPDKEKGKACPYGVLDITNNRGWVNVGLSKDTAEFAVESIRRWWKQMGKEHYPNATELLITADGGGSNGHRIRLWKREIQTLANETGLKIRICHFPPGTSKWNKIEHQMFSFVSKNWRGRPLDSVATIVNLISNTTTSKGLSIEACVDMRIRS